MLHQLKSGDWLDLTLVKSVSVVRTSVIVAAHIAFKAIEFSTPEEAEQYRDVLAKLVNHAQQTAYNPLYNKEKVSK